jgi:Ribosomal protein S5, C-terminal domain
VLTKSLGSANPHNVVRAAFTALQELKDPQKLMRLRGKDTAEDLAGGRAASEEDDDGEGEAGKRCGEDRHRDSGEESDRFSEDSGQGRGRHGPPQAESLRHVEGHT